MTLQFLEGLVEARTDGDSDTWSVFCRDTCIGTIDHHRKDSDWLANRRYEIRGSRRDQSGYGKRWCHGWPTLTAAVTELCRFNSALIIQLSG